MARSVNTNPGLQKLRLMILILHYLKDPKLWEFWSIPYYMSNAGYTYIYIYIYIYHHHQNLHRPAATLPGSGSRVRRPPNFRPFLWFGQFCLGLTLPTPALCEAYPSHFRHRSVGTLGRGPGRSLERPCKWSVALSAV